MMRIYIAKKEKRKPGRKGFAERKSDVKKRLKRDRRRLLLPLLQKKGDSSSPRGQGEGHAFVFRKKEQCKEEFLSTIENGVRPLPGG